MFRFSFQLNRAILGVVAIGIAIAISSFSVVRAERPQPANSIVYNCSSGTACVEGSSTGTTTWGIYGTATKTDGVHGVTSTTTGGSGVTGIAKATSGKPAYGVYGSSKNANGIYGETSSSKAAAVYGKTLSSSSGVYGEGGLYGIGVHGDTQLGTGVFGYASGDAAGVDGEAGGGYGLGVSGVGDTGVRAEGTDTGLYASATSNGQPIISVGAPSGGTFETDYAGDGFFSGIVTAAGFSMGVHRRDGGRVIASASLAPSTTIEDTGTARLEGGEAAVRFDPAFASTIDVGRGYQVFLTPNGETRGWLYVAAKLERGFIVREAYHGRSSVYFDYRIVAHPYGVSDDRLPLLNVKRPRIPHLPPHVQPRQQP